MVAGLLEVIDYDDSSVVATLPSLQVVVGELVAHHASAEGVSGSTLGPGPVLEEL